MDFVKLISEYKEWRRAVKQKRKPYKRSNNALTVYRPLHY